MAELAESYKEAQVPEHRFALPHMAKAIAPSADQLQLTSAAISAKAAGISLQNVLDTLDKDSGNTTYEELECLGLNRTTRPARARPHGQAIERLLGRTVHAPAAPEYVAFWADWDDDCKSRTSARVE